MTGFLSFDEPVIDRLSIWNQILSRKKVVSRFRNDKDLLRVRLVPFDALAYLAERLDLGLPQGIFAVAGTIDCSPSVMSILLLSESLIRAAIRSAAPIVISQIGRASCRERV